MNSAPFTARPASLIGFLAIMASAVACRNPESFDSRPGEAYCGAIGQPFFQDGFEKDNVPPKLKIALTLYNTKLSSDPSEDRRDGSFRGFGFLRSQEGDENSDAGICGREPLFADAPIRAIPEVERDVLSTLSFGDGHDQDLFAWVDSTCQGTMLAIVSLMKNNQIELRLLKPAPVPTIPADAAHRPGFAVFHLDPKPLLVAPEQGGCGFSGL